MRPQLCMAWIWALIQVPSARVDRVPAVQVHTIAPTEGGAQLLLLGHRRLKRTGTVNPRMPKPRFRWFLEPGRHAPRADAHAWCTYPRIPLRVMVRKP